jgi:dTDP-4-amino-4,6-dideoxygalactose transaminase
LYGQYLKIKTEIDNAMQEVIASSVFIKGGKVDVLEQKLAEYLGSNVVTCGNGTDALQLIFMALGLQPGDEVITSPFTFVATAEVLAFMKLKPVFVDVDPQTFNLDASKIEAAITPATKAIVPVHLFGQNADMEAILRISEQHNLFVVEDAAQSFGSNFIFSDGKIKKSGTIGIAGATSFFPSKTLGGYGDGGAVFCRSSEMADTIRSLANHGKNGYYQYGRIGINSRLDSLQAAILVVKLRHIKEYIQARQKVALFYDEKFMDIPGLKIPARTDFGSHVFHQYTIRTEQRDELKNYLAEKGIPTMVYYPKPLHLQEAYSYLGYQLGDLPVSERLSETVLSLPIHTELDEEQLVFIAGSVVDFFNSKI